MTQPSRSPLVGATPKHQQLRDLILGMARPGEPIPSERALAATYGISRATVREAIGGLVADGLLQRVQGLGTFAREPRMETRLHLASFTNDMRRRGRRPSTRVLTIASRIPPADVADWLGLAPDAPAWQIDRLRLADDEPMAVEFGWIPCALAPGLDERPLDGSLYGLLEAEFGVAIDHAQQTLWAEAADKRLGTLLHTPSGTPLLVFRRKSSARGLPVEHVVSYYRGDRYQVHMELSGSRTDPEASSTAIT